MLTAQDHREELWVALCCFAMRSDRALPEERACTPASALRPDAQEAADSEAMPQAKFMFQQITGRSLEMHLFAATCGFRCGKRTNYLLMFWFWMYQNDILSFSISQKWALTQINSEK